MFVVGAKVGKIMKKRRGCIPINGEGESSRLKELAAFVVDNFEESSLLRARNVVLACEVGGGVAFLCHAEVVVEQFARSKPAVFVESTLEGVERVVVAYVPVGG